MWIRWSSHESKGLLTWVSCGSKLVGSNRSCCIRSDGAVSWSGVLSLYRWLRQFLWVVQAFDQKKKHTIVIHWEVIANQTPEVTKSKPKKGEVISRSREGIVVSKWKDKRDVLMISNMHELKMVEVANKRGEKKMKPNMVRDYNSGMLGVDRSNQVVSTKENHMMVQEVSTWHFWYICVQRCLNSKYGTVKLPRLLKFREIVTTHLIGDNVNQVIPRSYNSFHYLVPVPATEKKKLPTKPCRNCWKVKHKETCYKCVTCDTKPALSVGECFKLYRDRFQLLFIIK